MVKDENKDYFKRLTLEAKPIKQKYKSLGTGKEGKLSQWSGYIFLDSGPLHILVSVPEDFPNTPPRISVDGFKIDFNEELSVLKNWREEYHITDVIDALREYLSKGSKIVNDKIISKRLAEELQRLKEISNTLLNGSEYVSIRVLRDTPSLREYKLMSTFSRYSKPKLNGKSILIKLTLPNEFPKMKPRIEIFGCREDTDLNLENYLENLPPLRDWNPNIHLFEVALSIMEFFNNFAQPVQYAYRKLLPRNMEALSSVEIPVV
jgi:ubiquitin-protein ligase